MEPSRLHFSSGAFSVTEGAEIRAAALKFAHSSFLKKKKRQEVYKRGVKEGPTAERAQKDRIEDDRCGKRREFPVLDVTGVREASVQQGGRGKSPALGVGS